MTPWLPQLERKCEMTLIAAFGPLIERIVKKPSTYKHKMLQSSAVLALTKLMTVSAEFCERHLRLAFTLLEAARDPAVRANMVIALGDMTLRFPNSLEPWAKYM